MKVKAQTKCNKCGDITEVYLDKNDYYKMEKLPYPFSACTPCIMKLGGFDKGHGQLVFQHKIVAVTDEEYERILSIPKEK